MPWLGVGFTWGLSMNKDIKVPKGDFYMQDCIVQKESFCYAIQVCHIPFDYLCSILCPHCGQDTINNWMVNDCCLDFELKIEWLRHETIQTCKKTH